MKYSLNPQIKDIAEFLTPIGKGNFYFIIFPIIFVVAQFIIKNQRWARISLFLLLSIAITGGVCDIIKFIVGRARPTLLFGENLYGFSFFQTSAAHLSFPSGHSTLITALMLGLCFVFTRYWGIFALFFLIISFTRVLVTAHYLSDIIGGIYLSSLIVPWLYWRIFVTNRTTFANYTTQPFEHESTQKTSAQDSPA